MFIILAQREDCGPQGTLVWLERLQSEWFRPENQVLDDTLISNAGKGTQWKCVDLDYSHTHIRRKKEEAVFVPAEPGNARVRVDQCPRQSAKGAKDLCRSQICDF